jgi:hypothetical protein
MNTFIMIGKLYCSSPSYGFDQITHMISGSGEPIAGICKTLKLGKSQYQQQLVKGTNNGLLRRHMMPQFNIFVAIIILLIYCCSLTTAATLPKDLPPSISAAEVEATLARLSKSGTIVIDHHPPPVVQSWKLETFEESLLKRQNSNVFTLQPGVDSSATASSQLASSTTITKPTSSSTLSTSAVATATTAPGSGSSLPLPQPFDSALGANFTSQACPNFISNFLANSTFQQCLPFSLLLQVRLPCPFPFPYTTNMLTIPSPVLPILFPSRKVHRPHNPNPRRNLRRKYYNLHILPIQPLQPTPTPSKLRRRLHRPKPHRNPNPHRSHRVQTLIPSLLSQKPRHLQLLFRRCHHKRLIADRQLCVLYRAEYQFAWGLSAELYALFEEYDGGF